MSRTARARSRSRSRRAVGAVGPLPALALGTVLIATATACVGASDTEGSADSESGLPAAVADSGTLRVGMSPDFPPMEYRDEETDEVIGVDIDLVNALAEELGVEAEIVEQPFDQLLNSVQTGRVDIVMSGLSDTVERQETVDFVDYFGSRGRIYTLQENAGRYAEPADTCGQTLAVSKKTDYFAQIQNYSQTNCVDQDRPAIDLLQTDSGSAARLQLEQGRADLAMQGQENLNFFEDQDPDQFETVLDPLESKPFGIVVKKGDEQMSGAILDGMNALVENGTYERILTEAGMEYAIITPALNGTTS